MIPSPFRYHSLATSTYSLSTGGRPSFGCTTMAPYIPLAMWASTGFVPQWYMKTPGSLALKRKVKDSPGATSRKALFGAMRAAWKSIECGIAPPFVSVISTVWPSRTCTTGPGAPWPPKAHVLYLTPGAIVDRDVLQGHVNLHEAACSQRRQHRVVRLVCGGELGRVLGHDAREAVQRQGRRCGRSHGCGRRARSLRRMRHATRGYQPTSSGRRIQTTATARSRAARQQL